MPGVNLKMESPDELPSVSKHRSSLLTNMPIGFSEFLGTAILVYLICLGCTDISASNLQLAFLNGLSVMAVIQIFGHVSGAHVNPAVTVCAVVAGQIQPSQFFIYVICQVFGGMFGYALLMATTPERYLIDGLGVTEPNHGVSICQIYLYNNVKRVHLTPEGMSHSYILYSKGHRSSAIMVEAIATLILCFAICASWDVRNNNRSDSVPLKIGLVVTVLSLAAGQFSGASMNPARSFGPALWQKRLSLNLIYWIGPIIGGATTGIVYKRLISN